MPGQRALPRQRTPKLRPCLRCSGRRVPLGDTANSASEALVKRSGGQRFDTGRLRFDTCRTAGGATSPPPWWHSRRSREECRSGRAEVAPRAVRAQCPAGRRPPSDAAAAAAAGPRGGFRDGAMAATPACLPRAAPRARLVYRLDTIRLLTHADTPHPRRA